MNTKPANVLATLDKVAAKLDFFGYADLENHLESARAAVAELIAAIDEWGAAREAQIRAIGTDGYGAARNRYEAARDRFDAALARVKGE